MPATSAGMTIRVYERTFNVVNGVDGDVEVLAR